MFGWAAGQVGPDFFIDLPEGERSETPWHTVCLWRVGRRCGLSSGT